MVFGTLDLQVTRKFREYRLQPNKDLRLPQGLCFADPGKTPLAFRVHSQIWSGCYLGK